MSKKKASKAKTTELNGGPIRRTNRFFVSLRSYGYCDDNGRTILGIECSSRKMMATPDSPLSLMTAIVHELLPVFSYSSKDAAEKDLERFQKHIASLHVDKCDDEQGGMKGGAE